MINIFGFNINPKCSMDEIEKQFNDNGIINSARLGFNYKSNLKFSKEGFKTIRVVGSFCGDKVECIFEENYDRWCTNHKVLWKRHFWSFTP